MLELRQHHSLGGDQRSHSAAGVINRRCYSCHNWLNLIKWNWCGEDRLHRISAKAYPTSFLWHCSCANHKLLVYIHSVLTNRNKYRIILFYWWDFFVLSAVTNIATISVKSFSHAQIQIWYAINMKLRLLWLPCHK